MTFPETTEEVAAIVKACAARNIPFLARGAGTGLSGGAVAMDSVAICTARMNQIHAVDVPNRQAWVGPGVVNAQLSRAVAAHGLHYAPDPSSQNACTIGGNVAENSGGPHTLKYGVTTNHILALEVVLPDGRVTHAGQRRRGRARAGPGVRVRRIRGDVRHRHPDPGAPDARCPRACARCWRSSTRWATPAGR